MDNTKSTDAVNIIISREEFNSVCDAAERVRRLSKLANLAEFIEKKDDDLTFEYLETLLEIINAECQVVSSYARKVEGKMFNAAAAMAKVADHDKL